MADAKNVDKTTLKNETGKPVEKSVAPKNSEAEKTAEQIRALEEERTRLHAQLDHSREKAKQLGEEVESLRQTPPAPSDTDFARKVPYWEDLTPMEQQLHKEQDQLKREVAGLKTALNSSLSKQEREDSLTKTLKEYPQLKESEEDFRNFCSQADNAGAGVAALAKAFLYEQAKEEGAREEREKAEQVGLETATGGDREPPQEGYTEEEIAQIKLSDPKRYERLIKEGII